MSPYIIIPATIVAISSASILIRSCDAPAMTIASYRLVFAALFMLGTTGIKKTNPWKNLTRRDFNLAVIAGFCLALHFAAWITSLSYTSVASSVVLVSTTPIFVGVGSWLFLREQLSRSLIISICLTLAGTVVLGLQDSGQQATTFHGDALALLGAIAIAGYFLIGRKLRKTMTNLSYVAVVYSISALFLSAVAFTTAQPLVGFSVETYFLLFLIAFIPQAIGHTGLNWALKHLSATAVAILTLSEPIGASLLALFILGEKLAGIQILGGTIIIAAVALAFRDESRRF
ncbi:MAG: DMT family transporter [bacterium]